ncbi:MAG: hypothetical protein ACKOSS_04250 [Planctomycetia bacterium]
MAQRQALFFLLTFWCGAVAGWVAARQVRDGQGSSDSPPAGAPATDEPAPAPPTEPSASPAPRLASGARDAREAELEAEIQRLRTALAQAQPQAPPPTGAQPAGTQPGGGAPTAAAAPSPFRFGLAGETPRFDAADWGALAKGVRGLSDLTPRLLEGLASGAPDAVLMQEAGELNMPLATFAISTAKELGGTGPNGAFTHPAVLANLLRAALSAAGLPLAEAQEQALVPLGEAWVRDDAAARAGLPPGAPALAGLVAEVEAKARFMDGAKALLTVPQRSALFHPQTEGRASLDLFSPALAYTQRMPALLAQPSGVHRTSLILLLGGAGVPREQHADYTDTAVRWLDDTPWRQRTLAPTDPDLAFPLLSDLQAFARAQLAAMQRILDQGLPTPEQANRLRASLTLVMPCLSADGAR